MIVLFHLLLRGSSTAYFDLVLDYIALSDFVSAWAPSLHRVGIDELGLARVRPQMDVPAVAIVEFFHFLHQCLANVGFLRVLLL